MMAALAAALSERPGNLCTGAELRVKRRCAWPDTYMPMSLSHRPNEANEAYLSICRDYLSADK